MITANKRALYLLLCLSFLTTSSCQQQQKTDTKSLEKKSGKPVTAINEDDQVVELIMSLDEVKRKSTDIEHISKGKRHLTTYVETPPNTNDTNYWVKVSEDNGGSLVTYYTFAVNKETKKISFYDVVQDSLVSLDQWRKTTLVIER